MPHRPIHLSESDHQAVSAAVAAAEEQSAGEIVTIIAGESNSFHDVALLWAALAAFLSLAAIALFPDLTLSKVDWLLGRWQHDWSAPQVLALALFTATAKFLGVWLVLLWKPLRMALVPAPLKHARVRDRAVRYFKVGAERRTHGRTGILIYLSLAEHRAEIVADAAIAAKVEPEVWGHAMASLIGEIRQGRPGAGMVAAVEEVGAVLAQHFPRASDDRNELPDRLIEL
ncbi:MAG: TPM domain-containing protein [Novosphingobium sp.]